MCSWNWQDTYEPPHNNLQLFMWRNRLGVCGRLSVVVWLFLFFLPFSCWSFDFSIEAWLFWGEVEALWWFFFFFCFLCVCVRARACLGGDGEAAVEPGGHKHFFSSNKFTGIHILSGLWIVRNQQSGSPYDLPPYFVALTEAVKTTNNYIGIINKLQGLSVLSVLSISCMGGKTCVTLYWRGANCLVFLYSLLRFLFLKTPQDSYAYGMNQVTFKIFFMFHGGSVTTGSNFNMHRY